MKWAGSSQLLEPGLVAGKQICRKGLGGLGGHQADHDHDQTVCSYSQESQQPPGR